MLSSVSDALVRCHGERRDYLSTLDDIRVNRVSPRQRESKHSERSGEGIGFPVGK